MSQRNVFYYSLEVKEVTSNKDVTENLKHIYKEIFEKNCRIEDGGLKTLSLNSGQVTLDILEETEEFLFGRVGKETEHYNIIKRDTKTLRSQEVLSNDDEDIVLQVCTYFLLSYKTGIVGFVFGKSAPSVNALISIITDYSDDYFMNIIRIASPESVRALFKPGSALKKFKYVVRTPNIEILEALEIKDKVKSKMIAMEKDEIEIVIKNGNKSMFPTFEETKNFIETILEADDLRNDITLVGNSAGGRQKEFKFLEQDISYPIEIKEYKIEDNKKQRVQVEEINNNVYTKLKQVYRDNYVDIIRFAGKDYEGCE